MEPDDTPVGGQHPVLQDVIAPLVDRLSTARGSLLAIVWVHVVRPEVGVGEPGVDGISEDGFGALVDEGDLPRFGVAVDDDRVDGVDEVLGLAASRLLGRAVAEAATSPAGV